MAIAPLALNIFNGDRLWLSKYDGSSWTTQAKVADKSLPGESGYDLIRWTAGALGPGQVGKLGITVPNTASPSGLTFLGNGPPDSAVDIPLLDGATSYDLPIASQVYTHPSGAFYHSGAYWLFVFKFYGVSPNDFIKFVCLRSADNGATWAEQDTANAPAIFDHSITTRIGGFSNIYWNGSSNIFYSFLTIPDAGDWRSQAWTFDTSQNGGLGAWALVTDTFTPCDAWFGKANAGYVYPLSNGHLLAVYTSDAGPSDGIWTRLAIAGVWQAPVHVRASPNLIASCVFDPDTDTAYVFNVFTGVTNYNSPPTPFNGGLNVFSVDITGAASATLFTFPDPIGNVTANGYTDGIDNGIILNGSMLVLYDDWNDDSNAVWAWDMSVALNAGPGFVKTSLLPHPSEEPPSGPGFDYPPSCGLLFFGELTPIPPAPGCPTIYVARQPQPDAPAPPPPPGIPR